MGADSRLFDCYMNLWMDMWRTGGLSASEVMKQGSIGQYHNTVQYVCMRGWIFSWELGAYEELFASR